MSDDTQAPVIENPPVETQAEAPKAEASSTSKVSPAQELRDIQQLVVCGIFPGNMAPAVVKAYQTLDKMCLEIEKNA